MATDLKKETLLLHSKYPGKLATHVTVPIKNRKDLSLAYTPGVAEVCREIADDEKKVYKYTIKKNTVAVVTDGSAVLGLGNIGPLAALPVMEGKAALFKEFAGIDAFPICLATQDIDEIINIVKAIAPSFGGINLEDICAPRCFEIEKRLQDLGIPVMHDDQHGTAIVVLAGLINSAKVAKKELSDLTVVISGAGAAGNAITKFIKDKVNDVIVCDRKGIIDKRRVYEDPHKAELSGITNKNNLSGSLKDALLGADVFIGVSAPNLLKPEDIKKMAEKPIVFALANPVPEISPENALKGGAFIVASGRSDYPNQINNVLAFPGVFRGALNGGATDITVKMKTAAAYALAGYVKVPSRHKIIPEPFEKGIAEVVAKAIVSSM